ncbi:hypothetical protein [Thiobacter aerophilum]|uniref:Uncharacterized protein n=1 Tax=Thiobacter aerophilum TaxID=3121275 RepID=A0ABV0EFX3_9BURK
MDVIIGDADFIDHAKDLDLTQRQTLGKDRGTGDGVAAPRFPERFQFHLGQRMQPNLVDANGTQSGRFQGAAT